MTLRSLVAVVALFATPLALAGVASAKPGNEPGAPTTATTVRTTQAPRRIERVRPGMVPLKPRVIEAPGAALMMIPASYDPTQNGPFSPL